jgi:hypothetical protein
VPVVVEVEGEGVQATTPSCPTSSSLGETIFVVGTLGIAVDSSRFLSSPVLAAALSFSSSSLSRAANSAFHAWKALPAAFRVMPLSRSSRASRASVKASIRRAST